MAIANSKPLDKMIRASVEQHMEDRFQAQPAAATGCDWHETAQGVYVCQFSHYRRNDRQILYMVHVTTEYGACVRQCRVVIYQLLIAEDLHAGPATVSA